MKSNFTRVILLLIGLYCISPSIASCAPNRANGFKNAKNRIAPDTIPFNGTKVEDVTYGSNINFYGNNEILKLDVYIPPKQYANQKFPLVVFVHAGGFYTGDKKTAAEFCMDVANKGFVVSSIDYRLGRDLGVLPSPCDDNIMSENKAVYRGIQDTKASLRFLVANADSYSIDTNWVFLCGRSSGCVIALATAFMNQDAANIYLPGCETALGSLDSATNKLTNSYTLKGLGSFWGALASPNLITPENALPVLFAHGALDETCPYDSGHENGCQNFPIVYGSLALYNRLVSLSTSTVLHVDLTGGHGGVFDDEFNASNMCCFFNSQIDHQPEIGYYEGYVGSCVALKFYRDADSDGYGNYGDTVRAMSAPDGYIADHTDCNDTNAGVHPSALEIKDGIDNNCDGQIDEVSFKITQLSIGNASKKEGSNKLSHMLFTVTLSAAASNQITVNFRTIDRTATSADSDYLSKSGTLNFAPGSTIKSIYVAINGDKKFEPNESFIVYLSNPVNAQLGDSTGRGTIVNDDTATTGMVLQPVSQNQAVETNTGLTPVSLKAGPNPATGNLNVELRGYSGDIIIQMRSAGGKIVKQEKVQTLSGISIQHQINVSGLSNGIYFLTATDDKGTIKKEKIIVAN